MFLLIDVPFLSKYKKNEGAKHILFYQKYLRRLFLYSCNILCKYKSRKIKAITAKWTWSKIKRGFVTFTHTDIMVAILCWNDEVTLSKLKVLEENLFCIWKETKFWGFLF